MRESIEKCYMENILENVIVNGYIWGEQVVKENGDGE